MRWRLPIPRGLGASSPSASRSTTGTTRCSAGLTTSRTSSSSRPPDAVRTPKGAEGMKFGIVGLGRMGGNLARAAMEHGHEVVGYDRDAELTRALAAEGLDPADSLDELVR